MEKTVAEGGSGDCERGGGLDFGEWGRDPLILAYEAFKAAIERVHGEGFPVFDDVPDARQLKKQLPAANISYVSGVAEKAFMREFVPHGLINNRNGTFTVITETLRFDYTLQISFFAGKKGLAQRISTKFYTALELDNEIPLVGDPWEKTMRVILKSPPGPPEGEPELYRCDQAWLCRGKLLTAETVNAVDVRKLKFKIENMKNSGGLKSCLF